MLGIRYKKAPPTNFVMQFVDGRVTRQGAGLSFWYFAPTATIVEVPLSSRDVPFVFIEVTADFQEVTMQGQVTYRILNPARAAEVIDFTVNPRGSYAADDDPDDLISDRLINTVQVIARSILQKHALPQALNSSDSICTTLLTRLREAEPVNLLGLEILSLSLTAIKPTPEIARALEAESRETLQMKSDQAVYARRNAAVEEERRIKESELNTLIAVENKQREIDETRMAASIALEEQRTALIDQRVENERKDADSRAYALTTTLKPLETADWRLLTALSAKNGDPRFAISLAFQELAENAQKIGQLNVSPDLLTALMSAKAQD
jgi:hypothetical protein